MRQGTIVRCGSLISEFCGKIGVVTHCAGSRGHAGFKFIAYWHERHGFTVQGEFVRGLSALKRAELSVGERATVDRIKATLAGKPRR